MRMPMNGPFERGYICLLPPTQYPPFLSLSLPLSPSLSLSAPGVSFCVHVHGVTLTKTMALGFKYSDTPVL